MNPTLITASPQMHNPPKSIAWIVALAICFVLGGGGYAFAQAQPNPFRMVDGWAKLPNGRPMGAVGDLKMDPDGLHLWVIIRGTTTDPKRFGDECLDSDLDPILKSKGILSEELETRGWRMRQALPRFRPTISL